MLSIFTMTGFRSFTLVVVMICCVVPGLGKTSNQKPVPKLLLSSCNRTLYPDICVSTLRSYVNFVPRSREDPAKIAVKVTLQQVKELSALASRIRLQPLVPRDHVALADCRVLLGFTTEQLNESLSNLMNLNSESMRIRMGDVQTWLSASLTNLRTCMDGFENSNGILKSSMYERVQNVSMMVSNSLAIANWISDMKSDLALGHNRRRLLSRPHGIDFDFGKSMDDGFPAWISEADRRLLQAPVVRIQVNAIVAKDGTGQFKTIAAALNAAPKKSKQRHVIRVRAGIYEEKLTVNKDNIVLLGDGKGVTVVTGSDTLAKHPSQFTATFMASANGFLARDMTFQNTAGPLGRQAAALMVRSDRSAFYRCSIIGYQDTLYAHSQRQFYRECDIFGTIDFIFGNAAAVFQACDLVARKPLKDQKNMITAQGREDPNQNTGFSMHNCKVLASSDLVPVKGSFPTFLGRPWKKFSRTVFIQSLLDDLVDPAGWHEWEGNFALETLYYGEYMNNGRGAGTAHRVNWPGFRIIKTTAEARQFTVDEFIFGRSWLPSTGVAYQGGLIV